MGVRVGNACVEVGEGSVRYIQPPTKISLTNGGVGVWTCLGHIGWTVELVLFAAAYALVGRVPSMALKSFCDPLEWWNTKPHLHRASRSNGTGKVKWDGVDG